MPSKRKNSEPVSAPEPKRRVTRSSTKANAPTAPAATSEAERKAPGIISKKKGSRTPRPIKNAHTTNTSAVPSKPNSSIPATKASSTRSDVKSLTILSDLVKNPIQCTLYPPSQPTSTMPLLPSDTKTLIFTHGAGGTLSAPAVVDFCSGVSVTNTVTVLAFQGSMNLGSRVKGFRACVEYVEGEREEGRKKSGGKRAQASGLLVGGRSMGARAAVMAVLEKKEEKEKEKEGGVDLVLVSYPLKGPKDVRDQILLDLPASVNVLFIIGEKDAMCPLDLLNHVRNSMKAKTQLVVVKGADHGMKGGGVKLEKERGEETGRVAVKWLSGELKEDITYIGDEE